MKKAKIHMADGGDIVIELFDKEAPGTVQNFIDLINKGFYNGLRFHRVIPGFVAQGGCPNGNGTGGPGYTIKDELVGNPHKHERGALSMAHRGPNTGGSQFFIVYEPQPHLDGVHTVFGKVIEGMDVIEKIENTEFEIDNEVYGTLKKPLTIEKAVVDTKGYTYKVTKK